MSLVHNERTKLTANFLNALSSGVIIAGFVAPLIAVGVGFQPAPAAAWKLVASSLAWFSAGVALHLAARWVLKRLQP